METIFTNYLIQMVGAAVVLSLIGRLVIYPQRGPKVAKKTVADKQGVSVETLREFLAKFATSSNAIYHLYGSMSHFSARIKGSKENPTETAITGYKDLYGTSIMLTDPLCRKEVVKDAVESFQKFNNSRNLDSILLAVDQTTANAASELGFKLLKIGQEPLFDLQNYDPGKINSKIRSSIRQVEKKGIIVEQGAK